MKVLNHMINKEVMALKAEELGFDKSEQAVGVSTAVIDYEASNLMHEELIKAPCEDVSEAAIDEYYSKMGIRRNFQFIICNFEDDALKAREKVMSGELWEDVADEFNDGSRGPNGDYRVSIKYGQVDDDFEAAIFDIKEGEVTMPISSVYGWWILRFNNITEERTPPMDDQLREKIRMTLVSQCVNLSRTRFIEASCEKHELEFNETALWIIFQGLPENEPYLDPETQKPISKEKLADLDVPVDELDTVFYSVRYDLDAEPEVWTIGDYKELYDNLNTFQRPKRREMLGGVRNKILEEMIYRQLLKAEARERGFNERPEVTNESKQRSEQVMVTKLHDEVVKYKEQVTPAEMEEFWEAHKQEYVEPEKRIGRVVYCADEAAAGEARKLAVQGRDWDSILAAYSQDEQNREAGGTVEFSTKDSDLLRDKLFMMGAENDVSEPFPAAGHWAVLKLETIEPETQKKMVDLTETLGQRIKMIRKDKALNDLLEEWKSQYGVEVDESALGDLKSLEELRDAS